MPVYLHIANLVIKKTSVIEKYSGGIEQFRLDCNIPVSEINQEDNELFSLGLMNADEFDIEKLMNKGLHFDIDWQYSDDFTIINRYGGLFWEAAWLKQNGIFAWHIDADSELIDKADQISNMTMDYIVE